MAVRASFTALAGEQFVSLTTFRRSGEPVSTQVWVAGDGDALVITTVDGSGKVKRLRNDPRAELRPCTRRGVVAEGVEPEAAVVAIVRDEAGMRHGHDLLRRKYGLQYRLITGVEKLVARGRRERVILRVTPA